jgi:hypothetical protein
MTKLKLITTTRPLLSSNNKSPLVLRKKRKNEKKEKENRMVQDWPPDNNNSGKNARLAQLEEHIVRLTARRADLRTTCDRVQEIVARQRLQYEQLSSELRERLVRIETCLATRVLQRMTRIETRLATLQNTMLDMVLP